MKRLLLFVMFCLFTLRVLAIQALNNSSQPSFPGGLEAWETFLAKNLKYPKEADDGQTRVIVSFIVEKDGKLTHLKIIRSAGRAFDSEIFRVLKKSPKWIPAKANGKPIPSKYTLPVNIELSE